MNVNVPQFHSRLQDKSCIILYCKSPNLGNNCSPRLCKTVHILFAFRKWHKMQILFIISIYQRQKHDLFLILPTTMWIFAANCDIISSTVRRRCTLWILHLTDNRDLMLYNFIFILRDCEDWEQGEDRISQERNKTMFILAWSFISINWLPLLTFY